MIKNIFLSFLAIILLIKCDSINSQELFFNPIRKNIDMKIERFLLSSGYKKVTYYYDNIQNKDGVWKLFPWVEIGDKDYVLINVSKIPNIDNAYNYLIIYSKKEHKIITQSTPFFDAIFNKIFLDKLSKENYQIRIITNMEDDSKEEVFLMNF
jgi:ribulose bisphosphate carboxylase small subunit